MQVDKPGIYKMSMPEYQADPAPEPSLSRSVIKDLLFRSPRHAAFNHPRLNGALVSEENGKFDLGSAAHDLLLEGIGNVAVIEADDWRTKAAKEAREVAWKEGKIPLLTKQYEETRIMVQAADLAIRTCPELKISDLKADGQAELSFIWQEEGVWLKVRPDWTPKDHWLVLDYKTTGASANPEDVARLIVSQGWDIQAALYIRGVKALTGIEPKFIFVVQEAYEPYLCSFVGLPPMFLEMGKQKVDYGLFLWNECMRTGKWPAYPNRVCWIEPPAWALAAWELKAQEIGGIEE